MVIITLFVFFIVNSRLVSSIECYKSVSGPGNLTIVKVQLPDVACPNDSCVCVSYLLPCSLTMNNSICTPDEQTYGLWKWVHTVAAVSSCLSLQETYSKIYSDFLSQCNSTMSTLKTFLPTTGVFMPTIPFHVPSAYPTRPSTFHFTPPFFNQTAPAITSPTVPTLHFNISFTTPDISPVKINLSTISPAISTLGYSVPTFQVNVPTFQPRIPTIGIQVPNISVATSNPTIPFFTPMLQFNMTTMSPINVPTFYTDLPTVKVPLQNPCSAYATLKVDCCVTNLCNIAGLTLDQILQAPLIQYDESSTVSVPLMKRRNVRT